MAKKKASDDPPSWSCERNADGMRVLKVLNEESGQLQSEEVATVTVHRFGKERATGEVGISAFVGDKRLGFDHFEAFKKICKGHEFDWRVLAWVVRGRVGAELTAKLRGDGFRVVEKEGRGDVRRLSESVVVKFGALNVTNHELVAVPGGFAVLQWDSYEYPCALADALILEEAGIACGTDVKERLARVRAAAF